MNSVACHTFIHWPNDPLKGIPLVLISFNCFTSDQRFLMAIHLPSPPVSIPHHWHDQHVTVEGGHSWGGAGSLAKVDSNRITPSEVVDPAKLSIALTFYVGLNIIAVFVRELLKEYVGGVDPEAGDGAELSAWRTNFMHSYQVWWMLGESLLKAFRVITVHPPLCLPPPLVQSGYKQKSN